MPVAASSLFNDDRGNRVVVDLTDLVRRFINDVDYEVCDLGYDLAGIVEMYSSDDWLMTDHPGKMLEIATKFCDKNLVRNFEDAYIVADYVINRFYPAIHRYVAKLGYTGAKVIAGQVYLSGGNRKLYCNALMLVK